jgi:histidinol phosphatase-like PHP family hydrolase
MNKRIEFHTHSTLSDGELIPSELIRRAQVLDYEAITIADHVDFSNVEFVIDSLNKVIDETQDITVLLGVEITHVPPGKIPKLVDKAKKLGAQVVLVHGETPLEPVAHGTNHVAASLEGVNIIAHPGLITREDAELAHENGIFLELTTRCGHNVTNGHVAKVGTDLLVNTDCHSIDLITYDYADIVARGAGLTASAAARAINENPRILLSNVL